MGNERHDLPDLPDDGQLEALLASLDADDLNPPAPPAALWDKIAAEIAADDVQHAAVTRIDQRSDSSTHTAKHRIQPRWWAAAAAALLVVAGAVVWFATRPTSRVVATARLQHEADFDAAGADAAASAELIERNGEYLISLQDSDLPNNLGEPADLELWLIEADADGSLDVQPVAVIDQGDGTYAVPSGLNPETHNIVDISIEPRDGDTTHSGRSILRGTLVET